MSRCVITRRSPRCRSLTSSFSVLTWYGRCTMSDFTVSGPISSHAITSTSSEPIEHPPRLDATSVGDRHAKAHRPTAGERLNHLKNDDLGAGDRTPEACAIDGHRDTNEGATSDADSAGQRPVTLRRGRGGLIVEG